MAKEPKHTWKIKVSTPSRGEYVATCPVCSAERTGRKENLTAQMVVGHLIAAHKALVSDEFEVQYV